MRHRIDLQGKKFGEWSVLGEADQRGYSRYWHCQCSCGNRAEVLQNSLRRGSSSRCKTCANRSNGSTTTTHGLRRTTEYTIWCNMLQRCINENSTSYPNYGGRGIGVCDSWKAFENFYEDMGARPDGKTLDRVDNNGNYCKDNCRWATPAEQARNKRVYKRNKSGVAGVHFKKEIGKWVAQISINCRRKHIGCYASKEEAIAAREEAEDKLWVTT